MHSTSQETTMQAEPARPPSASELDDDTLAFVRRVFGHARAGDAAELATLLLDHGAQVDTAGPNGKTALMFAAMFNRADIARLLLARGADPFHVDADGNSLLDAARKMGAADTMELLAAATNER
jgi:ankyrin repeat protein